MHDHVQATDQHDDNTVEFQDATLPLSDIAEGHRLLEEGDVFGKVVLEL